MINCKKCKGEGKICVGRLCARHGYLHPDEHCDTTICPECKGQSLDGLPEILKMILLRQGCSLSLNIDKPLYEGEAENLIVILSAPNVEPNDDVLSSQIRKYIKKSLPDAWKDRIVVTWDYR